MHANSPIELCTGDLYADSTPGDRCSLYCQSFILQILQIKEAGDLVRVQLPHPADALVERAVDRSRNGERPTNDRANAGQEAGEGLWPCLAVDDLHGRDVVVEEDAGDPARGVDALLVALVRGVAAAQGPLM